MNTQNQRLDAAKMARELNAPNTLAIINDETKNSPIGDILKSADNEVGREKLIKTILNSDHPFWALGALRYLPNIGSHEADLKKKAGLVFLPSLDGANQANARGQEAELIDINTFKMYLACGIGYIANFTVYYFTPPFSNSWNKSTIWSGNKIPVCQSQTKAIGDFSMPDFPLKAGDVVMMTVGIGGGPDTPTEIWFRYKPDAKYTAQIDCHGTTLIADFSYSVVQG